MRSLLAVAAVACAAASGGAAATATGLKGTVLLDPARPVCRVDEPCAKPAPGVTLAFFRGETRVARTTTDRLGRYRVHLAPATYRVKLWRRRALELRPPRV